MAKRGSRLAVQLYTLREFTKTGKDLAETLKRVAGYGYPAVQFSAVACLGKDVSAREARKMLDDNGLTCIATHRGWTDLMTATDREIALHKELGCDYAAIGGIPAEYGHTPDGYRRWLNDARPVIAALKAAGIRFGIHNHSHEFMRFAGEKHGSLEGLLVAEGGPDLFIEMDLYWVEHAGFNCVRWVERCAGRLPVIHLKDKEVVTEGPVIAPIGEGNMDWPHIIPACEAAGVRWYAVEQDVCRRDPFDCVQSSFDFLAGMGL